MWCLIESTITSNEMKNDFTRKTILITDISAKEGRTS